LAKDAPVDSSFLPRFARGIAHLGVEVWSRITSASPEGWNNLSRCREAPGTDWHIVYSIRWLTPPA